MYWNSKFKKGDKVKVVSTTPNSATLGKVGETYTLKSQSENDQDKKLWTTEELGFWCVSEKNIKKI